MFSLAVDALELPLVHTFTIARGSESVARTARFRLRWDGGEGLGESSPVPRYHESVESIQAYFEAHPPRGGDPYLLDALLEGGDLLYLDRYWRQEQLIRPRRAAGGTARSTMRSAKTAGARSTGCSGSTRPKRP